MHARRRTIEPSLMQGLVSCQKCGYALARVGPVERRGEFTTTAVSDPTDGGTSAVPGATRALCGRTCWTSRLDRGDTVA